MILDKAWTDKEIFFSEKTQIDLSNYVNDSIRLIKKNEEKLKRGDLDVYELITRPKKIGKIYNGCWRYFFSRILKINDSSWTENEFCYAQTILNYQKDIENLNKNLIFEQEGVHIYTSKATPIY